MSASELQKLRDRVEQLEAILGIHETITERLRVAFGITPYGAKILGMLMARRFASNEAIYAMLYGARPECDLPSTSPIKVHVHKLRLRLREFGIEIATLVGDGYSIKPECRQKVHEIVAAYEAASDTQTNFLADALAGLPCGARQRIRDDFPTIPLSPIHIPATHD